MACACRKGSVRGNVLELLSVLVAFGTPSCVRVSSVDGACSVMFFEEGKNDFS